jgi:putative ATPase
MKELGYGKTYRYAHDEPHAYAAGERYLPDGMHPPGWYQPTDRGLEAKIADKLAWLRSLDAQVRPDARSDPDLAPDAKHQL